MPVDLKSARHWAREIIEEAIPEGGTAIDATMGNGHDTLWLCQMVGERGHVYAFDVQPEALESTRARLAQADMDARAELILDGHQHMAEHVRQPVDAILFNLGWLPGVAHAVTTRTETTLAAVNAALTLLRPGGAMTICVYPGHEEGKREREALLDWAAGLDSERYDACVKAYLNIRNDPPVMIAVAARMQRKDRKKKSKKSCKY
ncbi:MAG: class I SAM-dependent methyltransferase [Clostridia bacterium]|nr:class I SAM-dependent methyltransferase [Clostridia bacterium]